MPKAARVLISLCSVGAIMIGSSAASFAAESSSLPSQLSSPQSREFHGERYSSPDGKHWVKVTESFVELGTLEGETISVSGNKAIWKDAKGDTISVMEFTPEDPNSFNLSYDPETHRVGDESVLHPTGERCAPKWQAAGINIAWDGLVCAPLGIATLGTAAFGCGVIGTIGAAAISC
ncbi:hypothetical protein L1O03_11400 [Corynebacterium uropygiale]|uniref:Secreted protein n=1 Tax=Corynebacterium uropygiale TaxID=1775911 RepID=A0A9X1QVH9_9CORY|nr:hypothetical protein [Corynebacterium uropygiale]MCF4007770.1 hypothetical protein [Corynebacterium uropygiale]